MKKNLIIIVAMMLLIGIYFVSADSPYELKFNYNENSNNSIFLNEIHYSQSILVNVLTTTETTCKWGENNHTIENNFDTNYGTNHEITFENLEDGLHQYYIQCDFPNKTILHIAFKTKTKIYARIQFSQEPPLKAGIYNIDLITSTTPGETPKLEYSLDGTIYKPLPLTGSGKNWKTQIVIEKGTKETIGSFRFQGKDLDGVIGTRIIEGGLFEIDTLSPRVIENLEAIGKVGEIKLSWYFDGDATEYKIYKSENPGVDKTDYLETTDKTSFLDTGVENGKTYYYKISAADEAGNEGSLSREIHATALLSETGESTGLNPQLLGKVDNVLTEINLLKEDIKSSDVSITSKNEKEKQLFEDLKLDKEITSALSELESLEKDVTRYKSQDLTEDELTKKLNQAELRMGIIRKKVPETITIDKEYNLKREPTIEQINEVVLEYGQDSLTESEQKKAISLTQDLLNSENINIQSSAYSVIINYLDGSSEEKTVIKDKINSSIEKDFQTKYFLLIPKSIAEKSSDLVFTSENPEVIKSDPLLAFDLSTEEIIYSINKKIDPKRIEDIILIPVKLQEEKPGKKSLLTGMSIFQFKGIGDLKSGILIVGFVLILIILYIILKQKNKYSEDFVKLKELIKKAKEKKEDNKKGEVAQIYEEIREIYKKLSEKEKNKIYKKLKGFTND